MPPRPTQAPGEHAALLVCDDDPAVLELICDALAAQGYDVVPVTSGRAALSVVARDMSIRLMVVDFTMPEMNGGAVTRAVLAERPDMPVLLITGNADPEAIQAELPDVAMLCKPFTPKQLTTRIAELLAGGSRKVFSPADT